MQQHCDTQEKIKLNPANNTPCSCRVGHDAHPSREHLHASPEAFLNQVVSFILVRSRQRVILRQKVQPSSKFKQWLAPSLGIANANMAVEALNVRLGKGRSRETTGRLPPRQTKDNRHVTTAVHITTGAVAERYK